MIGPVLLDTPRRPRAPGAPPTPPSFVQQATAAPAGGATNFTVTLPANPGAGSVVILSLTSGTGTNTITGVSGLGATWSQAHRVDNATLGHVEIWVGENCSGAAAVITVSRNAGAWGVNAAEFSGVPASATVDVIGADATGNSTGPATGTLTAPAYELVYAALGWAAAGGGPSPNVTAGPTNGFTQLTGSAPASTDIHHIAAYLIMGAASATESTAVTIGAARTWAAAILTVKHA